MVPVLRRLALALATGAVFVFFSETVFWGATGPDRMAMPQALATLAGYGLVAFVFLWLVERFRARTVWTVFLAGAVVGWLVEGVVVQTTYEALPLSISFTGLAWHALLTVLVGWYWLGGALAAGDVRRAAVLSTAVGAFWGLWSISWLMQDEPAASAGRFALFAIGWTAALAIAFLVANALRGRPFTPTRIELGLVALVLGLAFVATAVAVPIALAVLPVLLGLAWLGLRAGARSEPPPEPRPEPARPLAYAALGLIPAVAIPIYVAATELDLRVHTDWIVYVGTTLGGFVLFALSLRRTTKRA